MTRRILFAQFFLIAVTLVAAALAYPHLPAQIATHWGMNLQADGYSDRGSIFLFGPGLLSAIVLFQRFGPWLSPERYNVNRFDRTWQHLMFLIFCLIEAVFGIVVWSDLGHALDVSRAGAYLFCVFAIMFGNLLGKVRPNFFLGIRTPWTLANESVWIATHRLAAWIVVFSGICGVVLTFVGRPQWCVVPFVFALLVSAAYSLMRYKRLSENDHESAIQH